MKGTSVLYMCVRYTWYIEVRIFNPVYVFKKEILLINSNLEHILNIY